MKKALIIANGETCSTRLLDLLLQEDRYVVVLDGAIHRIKEMGIKFDVLLGDFDRNEIPIHEISETYPNVQIVRAQNQDKTDLDKAIYFLVDNGYQFVSIIWATGRRADHTVTNITNLCRFRGKIKVEILDDFSRISLLPRFPEVFTCKLDKGTPISLIPIGKASGISTHNLKYELNNEELTLGYRTGSSNEVLNAGPIEIEYHSGDLILMECSDKILGYVYGNN